MNTPLHPRPPWGGPPGHRGPWPLTGEDPLVPVEARVVDRREEGPATVTLSLRLEDTDARERYRFRPGQFNLVGLPGLGEAAYTLASDPFRPDIFEHTVRAVGGVSGHLVRLEPGDPVLLRGPLGNGWPMERCAGYDLLLVGGGVGMPALLPVLHQVVHQRPRFGAVTVLAGARCPSGLLYRDRLAALARQPRFRLMTIVDRVPPTERWEGPTGLVTDFFDGLDLDPAATVALACGPEPMMKAVAAGLTMRGLPADRILLSLERSMQCGIGQCGHCFLARYLVCRDGPIFSFAQVERFLGEREV